MFLIFSAPTLAQGMVAGQLLKSNGKPLAYTEIERVPLRAQRLVNLQMVLREYRGYGQMRDKYTGGLVPANKFEIFDSLAKGE